MSEKDFSKKILQTIKERHLKPTPRWHFLLKDYVLWGLTLVSFVIGSLAFAVVLYMIINNDWDVYENINDSLLEFIFVTLPYFWIVLLVLFIIAADYNIRHTKKGYRYGLHIIVLASVFGSMIVGTIFYNVGLGQAIDDVFVDQVPYYQKFLGMRHIRWTQPEMGLLAGVIVSKDGNRHFEIQDRNNVIWNVDAENAMFIGGIEPMEGEVIRMIGERTGENVFTAHQIIIGMKGPGFRKFRMHHKPLNLLDTKIPSFERNLFPMRTM